MNPFLLAAGLLCLLVGLIHSALGELLIFNKLRKGSLIPTIASKPLQERNIRILWATWHLASIFGWAMGAILILLSGTDLSSSKTIIHYIAISMLAAALLVLFATRAKHPGWIGLGMVSLLCWLATP